MMNKRFRAKPMLHVEGKRPEEVVAVPTRVLKVWHATMASIKQPVVAFNQDKLVMAHEVIAESQSHAQTVQDEIERLLGT